MTPLRRSLPAVAAGLLLLTACGDDSNTADTSTTATEAPAGTSAPTTQAPTGSTAAPGTTAAPTTAAPTTIPGLISVTVGVDSGPDRVEQVALGSEVTLVLLNPDADDEFHLHGFDLGGGTTVPAGQTATFVFTADQAGTFELESHVTDEVYLVLEVS